MFTVQGMDFGNFHSFLIPKDNHCLFHAFRIFLNMPPSTSLIEMQKNSIARIASNQNANIRVNHLNKFKNMKVALQAGDFKSRRFNSLWNEYVKKMSATEWAGQHEACTLADMYNLSVVVWRKHGSTASPLFSHQNALQNARTIHILFVNNNHYEITNIPDSFFPLHGMLFYIFKYIPEF